MEIKVGQKRLDSDEFESIDIKRNTLVAASVGERFGVLNTLIKGMVESNGKCLLYGIDNSGHLDCWNDAFEHIASDNDDAAAMLAELDSERMRRQNFALEKQLKNLNEVDEIPVLVLVVNEMSDYADVDKIMEKIRTIAAVGRSVKMSVLLCEDMDGEFRIPVSLRSNFSTLLIGRASSEETLSSFVGTHLIDTAPAHLIPEELPDVFYLINGGSPVLINAILTDVGE